MVRSRVVVGLLLPCFLGLTGCVSNKYKAASALGAQPLRIDANLGGAPVSTVLNSVIVYQGPGSWKKSAYWDEIIVTLTNSTDDRVTVIAASLVDYAGAIMPTGHDPWLLEKASQVQRDRYTRAGVNFALNTLGYAALTYGAVGAGMMVGATVTSTWGGLVAGATVGLVAVPVTAIVVFANNQKHKHQIESEFNRRHVALPLEIAPGEARTGSFFFPMTVSPQTLRLDWTTSNDRGTIVLPLPMLAGMHVQEPVKKSSK